MQSVLGADCAVTAVVGEERAACNEEKQNPLISRRLTVRRYNDIWLIHVYVYVYVYSTSPCSYLPTLFIIKASRESRRDARHANSGEV